MSTQTHEAWIPQWTFGDRLRKVRRERGLSQERAAKALGVTSPQIAAWESGANNPRDVVSIAKRMELAFNVPTEWVLGLEMRTAPPGPGGPNGAAGGSYAITDSNREPADLGDFRLSLAHAA